jgi:hypothetical protein
MLYFVKIIQKYANFLLSKYYRTQKTCLLIIIEAEVLGHEGGGGWVRISTSRKLNQVIILRIFNQQPECPYRKIHTPISETIFVFVDQVSMLSNSNTHLFRMFRIQFMWGKPNKKDCTPAINRAFFTISHMENRCRLFTTTRTGIYVILK